MVQVPDFPDEFVPYKELLVYEENKRLTYAKIIDGKMHDLDVATLLNGVDLPGTRPKEKDRTNLIGPLKLFYSYSHKDEQLRDDLNTHLKILERQHLIQPWHDRRIDAGENWKEEIDDNLEDANIILLLISADFIASDYCYEKELKKSSMKYIRNETAMKTKTEYLPSPLHS
jgi:internalin A